MFGNSISSVKWEDLKGDERIIDVREAYEFNEFHVPGAENVPLAMIASFDPGNDDRPIYVVCHSGARSQKAAFILSQMDIEAINIEGGMKAYKER